ncbi:MAG: N-acetylmuramoyl-L-alanine amidase [Caldilineales bacterium]|nr:N-acetylmuramoyl-L-alanine amidase [Caldilineales bacterium]
MARPLRDSEYIYGIHDPGGEHIMLEQGITGWVLVTEAIGYNAGDGGGKDYRYLSDKGLGVMVRLNVGYGGVGTVPFERYYGDFAQRCANFVRASAGANIWIIGNEMNHPIEWPGADWDFGVSPPRPRSANSAGEAITPQRYAKVYRMVRDAIRAQAGHANDQVLTGAVAPWNNLTTYAGNDNGDWVVYFQDMLKAIGAGNCDGVTIHTYSHGTDPRLIDATDKMAAPFQNRHYHFRAYQDFMRAIPSNMRNLPVYCTETDQDEAWQNENKGWVQRAYGEIDYWNKNNPQQIRALILYRWPRYDKWYIEGKQGVIEDFRAALQWKLKWRADVVVPVEPPTEQPTNNVPYRASIRILARVSEGKAGQEVTFTLAVANLGNDTWANSGKNPVRLGYRWLDKNNQQVMAPDVRTALPSSVKPGGEVQLSAKIGLPYMAGTYTLTLDMVHEGVTWFADKGSPVATAEFVVTGEALPAEQFFPETKVWVRGVFLAFYYRYGLDICGYPITEAFQENGMAVQYFQRVALEEYEKGKVRLRLTAQQAREADQRITSLQAQIEALRKRPPSGGAAPAPEIRDVTNQLSRDAARMFVRPENQIRFIVINHTAVRPEVTLDRIAAAHRRTWPAIVCQFYVEANGAILQTNPITEVVDDKQAWLFEGVNIHVAGNFSTSVPTEPQIDALARLCAWLLDTYNLDTEVVKGAKEFVRTASPGAYWDAGPVWKNTLVQRIEPLRGTGETDEGGDNSAVIATLREQIARLEQEATDLRNQVAMLEETLREGGGGFVPPTISDVTADLPRDANKMIARKVEDIKSIVIHHTAAPPEVGVERVAQAHKARWPAIVSHYFIAGDGAILQTNPVDQIVDDKKPWLLNGINIHVAGNFNFDAPAEAQLAALAQLAAWLMQKYSLKLEDVKGIRELIATQSPGEQWLTGKKWKTTLQERIQAQVGAPDSGGIIDSVRLRLLERQVQSLTNELEQAKQQAEMISKQLDESQKNLQVSQLQVKQLQSENAALEQQLKEALDQSGQPTDSDALRKQITELNNTIDNLRTTNASQAKQIADLQKQLREGGTTTPGVVLKPPMTELVDKLVKSPTAKYDSRPLSQITHIAIHHSAAPANVTPETIANYHVNNESHKWPGIGYHYYIGPDGTIYHTQDLTLSSYHVYMNNGYSVGICVAGNFTDVIPTPAQLDATGRLTAWLMQELKIPLSNVWGHKEFPKNATACPGNQWTGGLKWKDRLMASIAAVQSGQSGYIDKSIEHYLLFWQNKNGWAQQDWEGAINYIGRFLPSAGFSADDAKSAHNVTIVGGTAGVSQQDENDIRTSGTRVERISGRDFAETKSILDRMAATGQRYLNQ